MPKPRRTLKKDLERVLELLYRSESLSKQTIDAEARLFAQLWQRAERRGNHTRQRYERIIYPIDRGEAHY